MIETTSLQELLHVLDVFTPVVFAHVVFTGFQDPFLVPVFQLEHAEVFPLLLDFAHHALVQLLVRHRCESLGVVSSHWHV